MTSAPASSRPNSNFVSARMTPRSRAWPAANEVELDRHVADAPHEVAVADELRRALEVDRLVVAGLGLRRRREDRRRQALGLAQAGRELDPGDLAGRLVVLPARAGDVAAHDALDREHLQPADDHRAAAHVVRHALGRRDEVVVDDVAGLREPERRQAGQHRALPRDPVRMHDVVRRDPVAGDHQDAVAQRVHLSDLAARDQRQVGGSGGHAPQASSGPGGDRRVAQAVRGRRHPRYSAAVGSVTVGIGPRPAAGRGPAGRGG